MKIKIICLEEENKIKFDNNLSKFEMLDNKNFKIRAKYYNVEKNIVEVYYLIEESEIDKCNLSRNSDKILVIVKSLNENNMKLITKLRSNYDITVVIGEVNITNKNIKEEFNKLNNVIIINKLKKENTIDLKLLSLMLNDKEIICNLNLNKKNNIILINSDESIGKIVLSVLEQFKYIQNSKEYNLYLYSKEEVGIQELTYLEDPIREYIYNDAILKVNTAVNDNINDKKYFLIVTTK